MSGMDDLFGGSEPLPGNPADSPASDTSAPAESQASETGASEGYTPPPAPVPEAQPDQPASPAVQALPAPQPHDQLVSAVTEERARRRELQEQNSQLQAQLNELLLRASQPQQPQQQIPSYDENPAEHLRAMQQHYEYQLQNLQAQVAGHNQRTQVTDQHAQFVSAVGAAESEFASKTPDYHSATSFVQARKLNEYRAVGLNDVEARQALARDTMAVAQLALQRGQNPAEVMYGLAKTMGYGPTSTVQRAPAPSSLQSTGGAPGAETAGTPTPEAIASMNDSEFDAWWNKMASGSQARGFQ